MAATNEVPITTEAPPSPPEQQQHSATAIANQAHLRQKRARSQLSCTPCRQGKLKCNRERDPACDQCIKRGRDAACIYVPPPVKNKPSQNVKGRIRQLETLVVDLMNKQNRHAAEQQSKDAIDASKSKSSEGMNNDNGRGSQGDVRSLGPANEPTPPSDNEMGVSFNDARSASRSGNSPDIGADVVNKPFGQMKISKNEISYVGESHWQAILDGISDLKRDFADENGEDSRNEAWGVDPVNENPEQTVNSWGSVPMGGAQPHATAGLAFMVGQGSVTTKQQLIESMPEKKVADRLLSLWFNSPDPFKPIIHAPTFQDEYRRFWRNPQATPAMWLGILFAILSLAESFGLRDSDPTSQASQSCLSRVNQYHDLAASAAVLGDFTKPKQYTLECLILYSAGLRSNNAFVNVWLMIGLVVRLGLRMGYHRDPSQYSNIPVFHAEMRRRVWCVVNMIDTLISFQLGLPSMVRTINSDTEPPQNLLDRDFRVDSKALPPSRGLDELTPASYLRAKTRIVRVFAQAAELSHLTVMAPTEEVQRLDRELEEAKALIPPLLKMPDISEDITDPAEQLMCRFNLDLLYLKTKTVLHRRYMQTPLGQLSPEEQARGIGVSRKHCIECALRVLQHHHTIYQASQPGGQLESVKWYMGSISTHDFLLAAMILCLELNQQITDDQSVPHRLWCPRRLAMLKVLEQSQSIWEETSRKNKRAMTDGNNGSHASNTGNDNGASMSNTNVQGWKSGWSHMFDETEKASRATAIMIEKVKKAGLPQHNQSSRPYGPVDHGRIPNGALGEARSLTPTPDVAGKDANEWSDDFGIAHGPSNISGNGGIDNYPGTFGLSTGNPFSTPEFGFSAFDTTTASGANTDPSTWNSHKTLSPDRGVSMSFPQDPKPDQDYQKPQSQDFDTIVEMIDLPTNFDWENFDAATLRADKQRGHPQMPLSDLEVGPSESSNTSSGPIAPEDYVLFGPLPTNRSQPVVQSAQPTSTAGNTAYAQHPNADMADWNFMSTSNFDLNTMGSLMDYTNSGNNDFIWEQNQPI